MKTEERSAEDWIEMLKQRNNQIRELRHENWELRDTAEKLEKELKEVRYLAPTVEVLKKIIIELKR